MLFYLQCASLLVFLIGIVICYFSDGKKAQGILVVGFLFLAFVSLLISLIWFDNIHFVETYDTKVEEFMELENPTSSDYLDIIEINNRLVEAQESYDKSYWHYYPYRVMELTPLEIEINVSCLAD